jgi:hypothetical protein
MRGLKALAVVPRAPKLCALVFLISLFRSVDIDLYFNGHHGSPEVDEWMVSQQVGRRW